MRAVSITRVGVLLVLAGLAGGVSEAFGEEGLSELYRQIAPSCVTLRLETHTGEESTGRGFLFDEQTVATSRHVLLGCTAGTIEFHDGERVEIRGVVADDPHSDLALLRFRPAISNAKLLEVATDPPRSGERVAFIGLPPVPACVLAEGVVSALRPHPIYGACAEFDAKGIRGARGSPLIDMRGRIVGVVVASLPGEQSLNLAVDSGRVGELHPSEVVRLRRWNHIPGKRAQEYIDAGDRMFMAGDFKAAIYLYEMAD